MKFQRRKSIVPKLSISMLVILLLSVFVSKDDLEAYNKYDDKTVEIDLSGNMICNTSISLMKKALKKIRGVEKVEIDRINQKAIVTFDDSKTNLNKLEDTLSKAGFKANDKEADMMAYESLPECCKIK
ncbi:MAG: cation transporter [Ignavibacteria bacterium]